MQLVIGSTYESSRGFGRLLYLGETHDIDGYLPTFRTTKGDLKFYGYDQLPSALVEFAPTTVSRADELIACLEGEIAKRDEELAACRVAVENCELFRSRIAELENDASYYAARNEELRAELSAIKAQEPVAWSYKEYVWVTGLSGNVWRDKLETERPDTNERKVKDVFALYAAPVSEAKAQGVVMPERKTKADYGVYIEEFADEAAAIYNAALDAVARLNAAPVAPAADAGLSLTEWTKDADEWGGALNYAAWEFINECPEKSALLFNNTKGPLRAAIMKYAEIVAAHRAATAPGGE